MNLTLNGDTKLYAWQNHYQRFLNIGFHWDKSSLNNTETVEGTAIFITEDMVIAAMKQGKAGRPSGAIAEMIKVEREILTVITEFVNKIIHEENFPEDWNDSFITNYYKGRDDATDHGN